MKSIRKMYYPIFVVVLGILFLSLHLTGALAAPAPSKPTSTSRMNLTSTTSDNWKDVVNRANPYVHIVNGIAKVDPSINQHLSKEEVSLVNSFVAKFNSLPPTIRHNLHRSGTYVPNGINACCAYKWTLNWYWWGARIWLNSSAAQNFNYALGILGAAIGAAVGAGIGAIPGAVIGAIIGAVAASAAAFIDNECGNRGIFIDINWLLQVSLVPVC